MAGDFDNPLDASSKRPGSGRAADAELPDDDAWFDAAGREAKVAHARLPEGDPLRAATRRATRTPIVLAGIIGVLALIGLATGAFSSPPEAPAPGAAVPDVEALRAEARRAAGVAALDEATLLKRLDLLVASRPSAVSADAAAPPDVAAPQPADALAAVPSEPIETGTTVIVDATKPKVEPPKTDPAKTEPKPPKDPKATDPKVTDPKVTDPKPPDPKVTDPKPPDPKATDPKATPPGQKGPADEALEAAKAAADAKRWSEAKGLYDKAVGLSGGSTKALMGRGRASFELRQLDAAATDLKAVLAADPKHSSALQLLGSIAQEQGRKDEARSLYQRYLDAYPNGRAADQIRAILDRL